MKSSLNLIHVVVDERKGMVRFLQLFMLIQMRF